MEGWTKRKSHQNSSDTWGKFSETQAEVCTGMCRKKKEEERRRKTERKKRRGGERQKERKKEEERRRKTERKKRREKTKQNKEKKKKKHSQTRGQGCRGLPAWAKRSGGSPGAWGWCLLDGGKGSSTTARARAAVSLVPRRRALSAWVTQVRGGPGLRGSQDGGKGSETRGPQPEQGGAPSRPAHMPGRRAPCLGHTQQSRPWAPSRGRQAGPRRMFRFTTRPLRGPTSATSPA